MRPLLLHVSALNDAEYQFYTTSFHDLQDHPPEPTEVKDDGYYERVTVGVREVRAWLRGRYRDLSVDDVDKILKFFHPNLASTDELSGGQFFAALRLVVHLESGKGVDSSLAFVQANPSLTITRRGSRHGPPPPTHPSTTPSRPASPPKRPLPTTPASYPRSATELPPPPPARRPSQSQNDANPFHPHLSPPSTPFSPVQRSLTTTTPTTPNSNINNYIHATHNPFLSRAKSLTSSTSSGQTPPLPPRKAPPPPPSHDPSPSMTIPKPTNQIPIPIMYSGTTPLTPAPSSSKTTSHLVTPLMRQSLQASKVAQSMKKAEEELESERVLMVLKSTSGRGSSPTRRSGLMQGASCENETSTSESDERKLPNPPLPKRNPSNSVSSSWSEAPSLEQVATAQFAYPKTYHSSPFRTPTSVPPASTSSSSPSRTTVDLPPPKHPDRRLSSGWHDAALDISDSVSNSTPSTASSSASGRKNMFRSQSMHHPSPPLPPLPSAPPAPPARRRPESVQLTPTSVNGSSRQYSHSIFDDPLPSPLTTPSARPRTATTTSMSQTQTHDSPMSHIQRTLHQLQSKAQPKLDAALYKAEAGISPKRGFVRGYAGFSKGGTGEQEQEQAEEGLMERRGYVEYRDRDGGRGDLESDSDESNDEEGGVVKKKGWGGVHVVDEAEGEGEGKDAMKWPVGDGEGWKLL